ncbi:unnamed protein product [Adineta ricciae]|uniref:G-protein coupled receptors family 1 profile domain-containing protein n=1 Tax=Adineta ricciae TaxID=249248 RepID=A0A815GUY5_ADIRI|nr:unnamed protein product [Adineta ricciae]
MTLRFTKWAIFFTTIFWMCHGIPYTIFYDIRQSLPANATVCNSIDPIFNQYSSWMIYNISSFIMPVSILVVFGYLTHRNMASVNETTSVQQNALKQQIQRQLTIIIRAQILLLIVTMSPSGIFSLYTTFTASQAKSTELKSAEQLTSNLFTCIFYLYASGSFYIFFCFSKPFRKQMSVTLCNIIPKRRNQVSSLGGNIHEPPVRT